MNDKLQEIFREVMREADLIINDEMSEKDVASWNSLNNVLLINQIEESFSIKFDLSEILKIKNIGDIKSSIEKKLST